jgi:hypothetical protein
MTKLWGIGFVLVLGACASQSTEQRAQPVANEQASPSQPDPNAVDPEHHDAVERTFARKTTELNDCWTREYEKNHDRKLEGDLTVQMTVTPEGKATDVKVIKSTMNNPSVESCVAQTVGGWSFPEGHASMPYLRTVHLGAQF